MSLVLEKRLGWKLGGDFLARVYGMHGRGVARLTQDMIREGNREVKLALQDFKDVRAYGVDESTLRSLRKNILLLRAIDSKNGHKIRLEDIRQYRVDGLLGKATSRNMAHIIFSEPPAIEDQLVLMKAFNATLDEHRRKYFSFFLTNYRDNNRKRISFEFTYKLINYLTTPEQHLINPRQYEQVG